MQKNQLAPIVIALSALAWTPLAFSAGPQQGGPEHDHTHGQAAAASPQKPQNLQNPQKTQRDAAVDAQIAHLRALHERLSRAKTPEERQALMTEQAKVMQESMAMMRTMHAAQAPGGMKGGMQGGMGMGQRDMSDHMDMHHDMMVQHMELMQEMMQTMVDHMGMTSGGMMSR